MQPVDPEEPAVFPTEMNPGDIADRAQLVDTPLGRLALVFDRGDRAPGKEGDEPDLRSKEGIVVAIDAWCPHLDGPCWEGTASRGEIACPWHRWRYSLETGQCTWAPAGDAEEAAETEIRVFPTRVRADGLIEILIGGTEMPDAS